MSNYVCISVILHVYMLHCVSVFAFLIIHCMWFGCTCDAVSVYVVCLLYTAKWQYSLLPAEQVSLTASDIVTVNTDPPASCSRPPPTPNPPHTYHTSHQSRRDISRHQQADWWAHSHTHTHTCTHSHIHCIYRIAIKFGQLALSRYWRILNLANWSLNAIGIHTIFNIDEF